MSFEREQRYIVLKINDLVEITTTDEERNALASVLEKLVNYREKSGKIPLDCVVIESDWPEYERVWAMIERRMVNQSNDEYMETLCEELVDLALTAETPIQLKAIIERALYLGKRNGQLDGSEQTR